MPHEPGRRITQVEPFADHLVLHEWADAQERIRILRADGSERTLAFDEPVHSVQLDANPEYTTSALRFSYESLNEPPSIYEEDVVTGERRLLKRTPVLGDFDPAQYQSARGMGHRAGRRAGTGRRRLAPEHTSRRNGRRLALRVRGVRVLPPAVVLDRPALVPRPWRCLGTRPPARRRRAGTGLVPGREAVGQAQHVHGLHRLRGTPGPGGLRRPRPGDGARRQCRRVARRGMRRPAARAVRRRWSPPFPSSTS